MAIAPWDMVKRAIAPSALRVVQVVRDGDLSLNGLLLNRSARHALWMALAVENPAYTEAKKRGGWLPPHYLSFLTEDEDGTLHAPLYAAELLRETLADYRYGVAWVDMSMATLPAIFPEPKFTLSAAQQAAVGKALLVKGGVIVAPPGAGKCLDPQSLVWSRGLRSFGSLWGQRRIGTPTGPQAVAGWYDDGVRVGVKVTTAAGLVVDGTLAHRIWVRDDQGVEDWRLLGDLHVGDYVALARGVADWGTTKVALEDAYLLGLVTADGGFQVMGGSHRLTVTKARSVVEAVLPTMNAWRIRAGGDPARSAKVSPNSPQSVNGVIYAPHLREFLGEAFGWSPAYSKDRVVPSAILRGTRETVCAFLRGYFDGDGWCDGKSVACASASRVLMEQTQALLLGLGIVATLRTKQTTHLPSYVLTVIGVAEFAREIGFTPYKDTIKATRLAGVLARPRKSNLDVVPGMAALLQRLAPVVVGKASKPGWSGVGRYYTGKKNPTYPTLRAMLPHLPEGPDAEVFRRIVCEHRFWTPVVAVEPSEIQRIDCEVPEGHAFIANGMINHNTVMGMVAASRRSTPCLWVTHTSELARQAKERAITVLGLTEDQIGQYGGGKKRLGSHITIAYIQTLVKVTPDEMETLSAHHGFVICDEVHHAPAMTWSTVMGKLTSPYRLGLTATKFRRDGMDAVIEWLCGPEVARIGKEELGDRLVVPRVERQATHCAESAADWTELVSRVVGNPERARRIAQYASNQHHQGRRVLILASRVEYAEELQRLLGGEFGLLTGEMATAEKKAVVAKLDDGTLRSCVATTGLVGEGFDVPGFDVLHLATPVSYHGSLEQYIGRICRSAPGKTEALVVDWVDVHPMLRASAKKRRALYQARGWKVESYGC